MLNHFLHHSLNTRSLTEPELGEHPESPNLSPVCVSILLDTTRFTGVGSTMHIVSWILGLQTHIQSPLPLGLELGVLERSQYLCGNFKL